jgi:hypothetical protein
MRSLKNSHIHLFLLIICVQLISCNQAKNDVKNVRSEELRKSHAVVNEPSEVLNLESFENHDDGIFPKGWNQFIVDSVGELNSKIYFSQSTLDLDGQIIELDGYLMSYEAEGGYQVFSVFEEGSGQFGEIDPVKAVEVKINKDVYIGVNQLIRIQGKLKLTPSELDGRFVELIDVVPINQ